MEGYTEISLLNRNELTRLLELWTRLRVRRAVDELRDSFVTLCIIQGHSRNTTIIIEKCHVHVKISRGPSTRP